MDTPHTDQHGDSMSETSPQTDQSHSTTDHSLPQNPGDLLTYTEDEDSNNSDGVEQGEVTPAQRHESVTVTPGDGLQRDKISQALKRGVDQLTQGLACDQAGDLKEALKHYKTGLQYLLFCRKYKKTPEVFFKALTNKCEEFLSRAEKINDKLKLLKLADGDQSAENLETESETSPQLPGFVTAERSPIKLDDVLGLEELKTTLKECVILPLKFPLLFKGLRSRFPAVLLYGPPGVGKSYLTRALGGELDGVPYLRVSMYDFVSKYSANSERQLKELFQYANRHSPCLLILDDCEAVFSDDDNEGTSIRRIRTEFLVQFEGKAPLTVVVAVTLSPWTMNAAVRKRFSKRLEVKLPDNEVRGQMFQVFLQRSGLPNVTLTEEDVRELVEKSNGFTGADLSVVTRDAMMVPVREIQSSKFFRKVSVEEGGEMSYKYVPCFAEDEGAEEKTWADLGEDEVFVRPVSKEDLLTSLQKSKPSVSTEELSKFTQFTEDFCC